MHRRNTFVTLDTNRCIGTVLLWDLGFKHIHMFNIVLTFEHIQIHIHLVDIEYTRKHRYNTFLAMNTNRHITTILFDFDYKQVRWGDTCVCVCVDINYTLRCVECCIPVYKQIQRCNTFVDLEYKQIHRHPTCSTLTTHRYIGIIK